MILLLISIVWLIYGILGQFGITFVSPAYKNRTWTKQYKRENSFFYIILGVMWLMVAIFFMTTNMSFKMTVILVVVAAIPSGLYSMLNDKKWKMKLEEEDGLTIEPHIGNRQPEAEEADGAGSGSEEEEQEKN